MVSCILFRKTPNAFSIHCIVHPILVSGPTEKLALEHEHITLECTFDGNPLPNIEWEREGGQTLPVLTRRRIASTAALENNTVSKLKKMAEL